MSTLPDTLPAPLRTVRALVFDLFGTCLDWHTPLVSALKTSYPDVPEDEWSHFGFAWRTAFLVQTVTEGRKSTFRPVKELYSDALDDVLRGGAGRVAAEVAARWTPEEREEVSRAWSRMVPFQDTVAGVDLLRQKLTVCVIYHLSFAYVYAYGWTVLDCPTGPLLLWYQWYESLVTRLGKLVLLLYSVNLQD
jgi:hypothetical protein